MAFRVKTQYVDLTATSSSIQPKDEVKREDQLLSLPIRTYPQYVDLTVPSVSFQPKPEVKREGNLLSLPIRASSQSQSRSELVPTPVKTEDDKHGIITAGTGTHQEAHFLDRLREMETRSRLRIKHNRPRTALERVQRKLFTNAKGRRRQVNEMQRLKHELRNLRKGGHLRGTATKQECGGYLEVKRAVKSEDGNLVGEVKVEGDSIQVTNGTTRAETQPDSESKQREREISLRLANLRVFIERRDQKETLLSAKEKAERLQEERIKSETALTAQHTALVQQGIGEGQLAKSIAARITLLQRQIRERNEIRAAGAQGAEPGEEEEEKRRAEKEKRRADVRKRRAENEKKRAERLKVMLARPGRRIYRTRSWYRRQELGE